MELFCNGDEEVSKLPLKVREKNLKLNSILNLVSCQTILSFPN